MAWISFLSVGFLWRPRSHRMVAICVHCSYVPHTEIRKDISTRLGLSHLFPFSTHWRVISREKWSMWSHVTLTICPRMTDISAWHRICFDWLNLDYSFKIPFLWYKCHFVGQTEFTCIVNSVINYCFFFFSHFHRQIRMQSMLPHK